MAWISQGTDNETGLPLWFNTDTGDMKYGQYGSQLNPDAYDANGTMIATGWNPNMAFPTDQGGYSVRQLSSSYLANGGDPNDQAAFERYMRASYPRYSGSLDPNAIVPPSAMPESNPDPFESLLGAAALGSIGYLSGGFGLGDLWSSFASSFNNPAVAVAEGGMPTQVGGWSWEDPATFTGNFNPSLTGEPLMPPASPMMPPAVPETADTLKSWGLQETSPGVWSQPAMPDISMNAADWLKYGLQTAGSSTASSALKNLFSGNGSSGDIFSALGKFAPSLLGMYASNQQTNALKDLAGKYAEYGAPYRQQLADITADPSKFYNSTAAQQGVNTVLNKLSIGGNPSGSPYKQQLAVDSLWNDYGKERDRLAGFGGLTNYNAAAPSLDAQAVNSQGNMYNALGAGLNDIFNPKTSLADLLKQGKIA